MITIGEFLVIGFVSIIGYVFIKTAYEMYIKKSK
jgi:hypothetical protein